MKSHQPASEAATIEQVSKVVFPNGQEHRIFALLANAWPAAISVDALRAIARNPSPVLTRMRGKLASHFETEAGKMLDHVISIGRGDPSLVCIPNPVAEARRRKQFRSAFWAPYKREPAQTLILYTEVLFFRQPEHRAFVRFQDFNGGGLGLPSFAEFRLDRPYLAEHMNRYYIRLFELGRPKGDIGGIKEEDTTTTYATYRETRKSMRIRRYELVPLRYYVTTGEMYCVQAVSSELSQLGVPSELRPEHTVQALQRDADLILLGNVRTHRLVADLNGPEAEFPFVQFPFRIEDRGVGKFVVDPSGQGKRAESYDDYTIPDEARLQYLVYALVTRLKGPLANHVSTIIAAHHSAAFKGVAGYLQSDDCMAQLAAALGVQPGGDFPDQFQVLFVVRITRHEEEPVGEAPIAVLVGKHVPPSRSDPSRR
jgi:hypothetical protein